MTNKQKRKTRRMYDTFRVCSPAHSRFFFQRSIFDFRFYLKKTVSFWKMTMMMIIMTI